MTCYRAAAELVRSTGLLTVCLQAKYDQAQPLLEQALSIRQNALGAEHTYTITSLGGMADLFVGQGLLEKAAPILEQVVHARERVQGCEHPDLATALNNWASFLQDQVDV